MIYLLTNIVVCSIFIDIGLEIIRPKEIVDISHDAIKKVKMHVKN